MKDCPTPSKLFRGKIYVVEDSSHDYFLLERALGSKLNMSQTLRHFTDGESLLEELTLKKNNNTLSDVSLIILDLNLPGQTGLETLNKIRNELSLKSIPIIMLSSSAHESDVKTSYFYGANTYFVKPFEYEGYCDLMLNITNYWFTYAKREPQNPE